MDGEALPTVRLQPSIEVVLLVFRSRDRSRTVHGIVINVCGTPSTIYTDSSTYATLLESVTIIDPNLLCIFIMFLGDRRAKKFVFYYVSQHLDDNS